MLAMLMLNRVGDRPLIERSSSHTTVRTDRYTAVQQIPCSNSSCVNLLRNSSKRLTILGNPVCSKNWLFIVVVSIQLPAIHQYPFLVLAHCHALDFVAPSLMRLSAFVLIRFQRFQNSCRIRRLNHSFILRR